MKYEMPRMELLVFETADVITLSVGNENYDPIIEGEPGKNPWAY